MAIKLNTPPEDADQIREALSRGQFLDIATATGYAPQYVYDVIAGRRNNIIVWEAARDLIRLHSRMILTIRQRHPRKPKKRLPAKYDHSITEEL